MQTPADIIEQWFSEHFHNSAASRNTEIYNQLQSAKQDLIARFAVTVAPSFPSLAKD